MKLVAFRIKAPFGMVDRIGAILGDSVIDLRIGCEAFLCSSGPPELAPRLAQAYIPDTMVSFLEGGEAAMHMARQ